MEGEEEREYPSSYPRQERGKQEREAEPEEEKVRRSVLEMQRV